MAAFSYQLQHQNPFLLDSVFMPSSDPIKMCGFLEEPNNNNNSSSVVQQCFSQFYQPESMSHIPANVSVHENSSICCLDDQTTKVMTLSNNETSVTDKSRSRSSSGILDIDSSSVTHKLDKKRKTREGSSNSMTSAHSKNVRDGGQGKKQRKSINNVQKDGKEKKGKDENSNKKDEIIKAVDHQEAPTGYIHVRARRGQATDSHSLAERVRREKISERMKLLQALVPGCDKVTGKALMLDEIINYVQSLQNQVEFLSMKLASLNPMYYDFGMELDALMVRHDQSLSGLGTALPNMEQANPTNNTTTPQAASVVIPNTNSTGYPLMGGSASLMFQQAHFQNSISQGNNGQLFWGADDQRQNYINNQSGFSNNLCSFH